MIVEVCAESYEYAVKAEKAVINTETGSASMMGSVKTTLMPPRQEGDGE